MIYLLLAVASSAMVSICMRLSNKHVNNEMGMFMANYAVCIALSWAFMGAFPIVRWDSSVSVMFILGIVSGILYLVSFMAMKTNMKHNGIVLTSTFMKLGVLIPTLMAVFVFKEIPRWTQVVGIVLSVIAIITINYEKDSTQAVNRKSWLLGLLVLSGVTDAMANIYEQFGSAVLKDSYLLMTFAAAFLLAVILNVRTKEKISVKDILFGCLIGVPNYFSARFLLLALGFVDAMLVYPMYSIATIVTVTGVGVLCFHEKLSKKKIAALILIGTALIMLNV